MNRADAKRKLAAILAADVVGYSKLVGSDEEGTVERRRALRREVIDPMFAAHSGRIVKTTGDGMLVEFASIVDAVRCAVALQQAIESHNASFPTEKPILFRVGVNVGDVMVEDDGDLMGDGVNVAARLEGIAEPGGICLSEDAFRQIKDKLALAVTDGGSRRLKNIANPIRVYKVDVRAMQSTRTLRPLLGRRNLVKVAAATGLAALGLVGWTERAALMRPVQRLSTSPVSGLSIVVLPFANLSGDPGQDFVADGITENLTTGLSRIRNSFVIARNTAFTFKGKPIDVKQVGEELGVHYVLEGSVERFGTHVRVSVQLIDASSGADIWADSLDSELTDLLRLQDDVTGRLAQTLNSKLIQAESSLLSKETNPDAVSLAMQGWAVKNRQLTAANSEEARRLFREALRLDPRNVDALVGLAQVDAIAIVNRFVQDREGRSQEAEDAIARALDIDPNYARAHYASALVLRNRFRFEEALAEFDKALQLDPNLAQAYPDRGYTLILMGRFEESIGPVLEGIRRSPRDPSIAAFLMFVGVAHSYMGQTQETQEALDWFIRAESANANYPAVRYYAAANYVALDQMAQARRELDKYLSLRPGDTLKAMRAAVLSDRAKYLEARNRMYENLRKAGMPDE
jgi:adenylate cyclase